MGDNNSKPRYNNKKRFNLSGMNSITYGEKPNMGDHDLTFNTIFSLVYNIFRGSVFNMCPPQPKAAQYLDIALGIGVKEDAFASVAIGDIQVLICSEYLGKANRDLYVDFAVIANVPVLFIFSDALTNENIPRAIRASRIHDLFGILVQLFSIQEYVNIVGSTYDIIMRYAPMVLTVRLIEGYYERNFILDKDFDPALFSEETEMWFDEEALDIIHKVTDRALLEYGALVRHYKTKTGWV